MGLNMWSGEKTKKITSVGLVQAPILTICMPLGLRQLRSVWHPYKIAMATLSWGPCRRTGGPVGSTRQRQGQDHDNVYSGRVH